MNLVAGIDGAPDGWIIASAAGHSDQSCGGIADDGVEIRFVPELKPALTELLVDHAAIVIDMPIGLPTDGIRSADCAARERLGVRRSTFFPTPPRLVLDCDTWNEANERSKAATGRGLSKQAWNLVPKIRELDDCWSDRLAAIAMEGHPETSFAEMAGTPVLTKKGKVEGRAQRIELLNRHVSNACRAAVEGAQHPVDAIDALALVWTARRVVAGTAIRLGSASDLDRAGRPMRLAI